ncbi:cytochrome P450 [Nannocystis pusilla]|uniref:Cytochrome P450 n=1 Tax=Nannocystis pusilla TaxID=889268 RepID=A0ABS7TVQ3_9BACT|nr:cytochrome P450 [Nannocystis pusilla]MBZ5712281.1 cytochrome P450 [Nannocystis pusilla]
MTRSGIVAHVMRRTAPGPRGGLLGNLPDVAQGRMFELLHHMWRAHGDISCARVGTRLLYLVVHPDHIQHVLVTRRENYTKAMHRARPLIGDGLPASNGELWARQRKLLTPRFQVGALPQFAPPLRGAMERLLARWQAAAARGDELDLADEMIALTLDAILGSLLGERLDDEEARLRGAIRDAVDFVAASGQLFRVPLSWPTQRNRHFLAALAVIDEFVSRAIDAHRARPGDDPDLLTFLLRHVGDGQDTPEVRRLIRDESVSLLLGGHESTAQALTWLLYCLDLHPEARARVMSEVDAFGDALPVVSDRLRFPFLAAAAQEALRLYPPFWAFPRHVVADDELGGYLVPAGATVMLCPYLTHRHPALWDQAERFQPERFLGGVAQGRARASYLPFGYGPRTCIGNHMATTEIVLATAALLRRFEVERVHHAPAVAEFSTTLRPRGGVRVQLRARQDASARST